MTSMNHFLSTISLCLVLATGASAQSPDLRKEQFNLDRSGLAIQGYDPVSYFATGKAMDGKKDITLACQGVIYRFASTANRETFKANPGKYQPQYG
jgi:YHS domain-containing protein